MDFSTKWSIGVVRRHRLCMLFCLLFATSPALATHIVGGEMNYRYTGIDQYEVTLTVYRDCLNGQAAFDNPASVGIYTAAGALVSNVSAYITDETQMPAVVNSPCLIAPTNLCYEVAHYIFNVTLPALPGGYTIVYQRCCRNQTIINLNNVSNSGGTYLATIPDPTLAAINSNPYFNALPPTFICTSEPFEFDHSATDPDGDSLIYELCTPLTGGSRQDPAPSPPNPPPYTSVSFAAPYSLNDMMGGIPFSVNRFTGKVTATPTMTGQFVYGLCVKEYRNGQLIGESRRDFQLNVVPCPTITLASIFSPTVVCGSLTATFLNSSFGAGTYDWDFGIANVTSDTSTSFQPAFTYPDTGTYPIRLIAYSSYNVLCNDTVYGEARIYPPFLAALSTTNIHCSPQFQFFDQSFGANGNADYWSWNFGDGTFSSQPNPSHSFAIPGDYPVTLIASTDSGCTDTASTTLHVLKIPSPAFQFSLDTCGRALNLLNYSQDASNYRWQLNAVDVSSDFSPLLPLNASGNFAITLFAISDSGCVASKSNTVFVPSLPDASFAWQVDPCDSVVRFRNYSSFASSYRWDFGDSTSASDVSVLHTYQLAGVIPVTLFATSDYGCIDTATENIFFVSYKEAGFDFIQDSCSSFVSFSGVTNNAVAYHWDFGDGNFSTEKQPEYTWKRDGTYNVVLTVNGEYACVDSVGKSVDFELPKGERVYIPNSFTPNGDGLNDVFIIFNFKPCDRYSLRVFNRWGKAVYYAEDISDAAWDGNYQGELVPEGIYSYLLQGERTSRQGTVAVIR